MNLLKLRDVQIKYEKYLFDKFSLDVAAGERIVIIGPSGCGKSSLIKAILGQIQYEGQIELSDDANVGYMPQNLALLPNKTVEQNVNLPLKIKKVNKEVDGQLYEKFGLAEFVNKYPHQLSGGQAQRVSLMRALVSNANVLCIDEPLSKLDQITKEKMIAYFLDHFDQNMAIIYITHDLYEAVTIATKVVVINRDVKILDNDGEPNQMVAKLRKMIICNE